LHITPCFIHFSASFKIPISIMNFRKPASLLILTLLASVAAGPARGAEPIRVACLGDSITAGAKVNAATESYPVQLAKLLGAGFTVKNFGLGGATMIRRGKPNAFMELPGAKTYLPQIAIVDFGINDTRSRDADFWSHFSEFPAAAQEVVKTLLDLPTKPAVILCLPTANIADLPGMPEERKGSVAERLPRLVEVREKLRAVATGFPDPRVTIVDLNAVTAEHPEWFNVDGVHLKPEGYKLLAETLVPAVREAAKTITGSAPAN
jgi:acyl-CoA thioesterase I